MTSKIEELKEKLPLHRFVSRMVEFVEELHKGQTRRHSKDPYVIHPLRVACTIWETINEIDWEPDTDPNEFYEFYLALGVALAHDLLEDTGVKLEDFEIFDGFQMDTGPKLDDFRLLDGPQINPKQGDTSKFLIRHLVHLTTNPAMKGLRKYRKMAMVEQIRTASPIARMVKAADRLDNLSEFLNQEFDKKFVFEKYIPETLDLVRFAFLGNYDHWADFVCRRIVDKIQQLLRGVAQPG